MKTPVTRRQMVDRQRAVIAMFCGKQPPLKLFDSEPDELQDWIGINRLPAWEYPTSLSILEAAESIAISQVSNGYEKEVP